MSALLRYLVRDNPMTIETTRVIRRFLRTSGDTSPKVNLAIFSLLSVLYLWIYVAILRYQEDMGQMLVVLELVFLTLLVPGSLYAAISGERERLTWESLIMTRLSPIRIMIGKLQWRVMIILGIMALFIGPILLSHFCAHGNRPEYSLWAIFHGQAIIGTWSLFLAAFTLLLSAKTKRTVTTLSLLSGSLLFFVVLVPALMSMFGGRVEILNPAQATPLERFGSLLVHLNPFYVIDTLRLNFSHPRYPGYGYGGNIGLILSADYWRFMVGVNDLLPLIYLFGGALCLRGTLRALKRLGLPMQGTR